MNNFKEEQSKNKNPVYLNEKMKRLIFSLAVVLPIIWITNIKTIFENDIVDFIISMVVVLLMLWGCFDIYDTVLSKGPKVKK